MLILTRKPGQIINIGNNIVIELIEAARGFCKIGIKAPREIVILRGELEPKTNEGNKNDKFGNK